MISNSIITPFEDSFMTEKWIDPVALYEVEGEIYATDNLCTHGAARMSDGFLEGREIECPLHQGRFDVCTGRALCAPVTQNIKTYPVKIEGQRVMIDLS